MGAHTKWTLGSNGENVCMVYSGRHGVAQVFGLPMHTRTDWEGLSHPRWTEGMEVGRLIASAPDLLEACQEALTYCEHVKSSMFGVEPSHADQLRAAIRKATGEAS